MRAYASACALAALVSLHDPVALAETQISSPTPSDFAAGVQLVPSGDAPLQRIELPMAVYAGSVRADLGDLRVFDPEGALVPHSLVARVVPDALVSPWHSVPAFALPDAAATNPAAMQVRLDSAGAVISVQTGGAAGADAPRWLLLDASREQHVLHELELQFEGGADIVGTLQVEASDDLQHFALLVAAAPIARLHKDGERLDRLRVQLPGRSARYLRMRLLGSGVAQGVSAVRARSRMADGAEARYTDYVAGSATPSGVEFDLGARVPVLAFDIRLVGANDFVEAQLACRSAPASNADAQWIVLGNAQVYRLGGDGRERTAPPFVVQQRLCRYLRLQPKPGAPPLPAMRLRARWSPAELWFLRRGSAPHLLAYGSSLIGSGTVPLAALTRRDSAATSAATAMQAAAARPEVPFARLGATRVLGGEARRTDAAPVDWQRVLLWSLLVVGVALVVGLAVRVLRESRTEP